MAVATGYGTLFKVGGGESPTDIYVAVAECTNFSGPGLSVDAVETTHTSSTNRARTFIQGLVDGGEVSVDMNFLPNDSTQDDTAGLVSKLLGDTAATNFQMVFSSTVASTWTFAGLVTSFEMTAPIDDRMTASVTIKLSGIPIVS